MISKFVPSFVTQGITDHDYTTLVMRRYAESSKNFWTNIIKKVRSQHAGIIEPLANFQKTELKKYKDSRKNFEAAQLSYDSQLARYMGLSKNKEPSALREDAFQLAEARTQYIKASFDLGTTFLSVQSKLDIELVRVLSAPWILSPKEFVSADPIAQRIGVEMLRLKSWAKAIQKCSKPLLQGMEKAARDMEKAALGRFVPSRELNTYTIQNSTVFRFVPQKAESRPGMDEKHGWLFVKSNSSKGAKQIWVRRWIFVKAGMFGMLNISPSKTFVQESDKVGVLLCHVTPVSGEDRRFCFEVKTKFATIVFQAETLDEMKSWLQVFEEAKRVAIQGDRKSTISYAFQRVPPMISEFASTAGTSVDVEMTHEKGFGDSAPSGDAPVSTASISLMSNTDATNLQALMTGDAVMSSKGANGKSPFGAFAPFGSQLTASPLLNIPMPTSMSQEAILSSSILLSSAIPTAVTANYWGSVNWGLYQKKSQLEEISETNVSHSRNTSVTQISLEKYPSFYPPELRTQDAQLKALFQTEVGDTESDRVVLAFKGLVQPNPSQHIPCRMYFTSNNVYFYAHHLGFSFTYSVPLPDVISVEGRTGVNQDIIYFLTKHGTHKCSLFLESGRILQKRCQFLIDNSNSREPFSLEVVLKKLKSFGSPLTNSPWIEGDIIKNSDSFDTTDTIMKNFGNGKTTSEQQALIEKQFLQLYMNTYMGKPLEKEQATVEKQKETDEASPLADLSKLMSQLAMETEFDIPAKALFHIMFGETSPVFKYTDSGSMKRGNIELTPWKLINSQRMEREIHYTIVEATVLSENGGDNLMYIQRLEKLNDNTCYIVYERRSICKLPQGGVFYTTYRYAITRVTKSSCKLSIWSSVEWVKSSIFKRKYFNFFPALLLTF